MSPVIELTFDPLARLGGLTVPWQVLGVALASFVALVTAALLARREAVETGLDPLRPDDLLFVALGVVPGAVIGGRLIHGIDFLDVYARDPLALLDPARGSLSLLGAVLGGTLTALYIANLLDGRAARWAGVAAVPFLLAVGLGKLAQLLGGGGQGAASDAAWAVAFTSPGPWLSASPHIPSHPSQLYEGLWALFGVPLTLLVWGLTAGVARPEAGGGSAAASSAGADPAGAGAADWGRSEAGPAEASATPAVARPVFARTGAATAFLLALAWWLLGRVLVGFTWRDERLLGPLNVEQALALPALGLVAVVLLVSALPSTRRPPVRRRLAKEMARPTGRPYPTDRTTSAAPFPGDPPPPDLTGRGSVSSGAPDL